MMVAMKKRRLSQEIDGKIISAHDWIEREVRSRFGWKVIPFGKYLI